jgi:hypothetical protein
MRTFLISFRISTSTGEFYADTVYDIPDDGKFDRALIMDLKASVCDALSAQFAQMAAPTGKTPPTVGSAIIMAVIPLEG